MPLLPTPTPSPVQVHQSPEGLSFWMVDGEKRIRVFDTFLALHDNLDAYSGPLDQFHGKRLLEKHRARIEAAASRKYDSQGAEDILDGAPALFVRTDDL